jgi:hypothetical protein
MFLDRKWNNDHTVYTDRCRCDFCGNEFKRQGTYMNSSTQSDEYCSFTCGNLNYLGIDYEKLKKVAGK